MYCNALLYCHIFVLDCIICKACDASDTAGLFTDIGRSLYRVAPAGRRRDLRLSGTPASGLPCVLRCLNLRNERQAISLAFRSCRKQGEFNIPTPFALPDRCVLHEQRSPSFPRLPRLSASRGCTGRAQPLRAVLRSSSGLQLRAPLRDADS